MKSASNQSGRILWHELVTADPKAVLPFYGELFGWTTAESDMGALGKYTLFRANGVDVAGTIAPPPNAKVPPSWLSYAAVDDLDVALKTATQHGGKLMSPTVDIPSIGKFAVVIDPTGAALAPMQAASERPELDGPPPVGAFCWDELLTSDPDRALAFYQAVYGYGRRDTDMGPMGTYHVLSRGERQTAGIMKKPMAEAPDAWLAYVHVPEVDRGAERAAKLGGKIVVPPRDIPGIGRFSVVADPQGATIALFKGAPDAKM
jgi:predicted enzyme related to lactoylglutathione lyase